MGRLFAVTIYKSIFQRSRMEGLIFWMEGHRVILTPMCHHP